MRALGIIVAIIALLIGGPIVWWKINYPTYSYRYRMTVEVEVDGKVQSGSSVIQVKVNKQPQFGDAPPQESHIYGDAVFVDLGNGRNVIALLAAGPRGRNVDYFYNIVPTLFGLTFEDRDLAKLARLQGRRDVPEAHMPTFVTFTDFADPKSVRVVPPAEFPRVFGTNVHLKDVTIEITKDAVTRTIEKKMSVIIGKLREDAKISHVSRPGSPYRAALGNFSVF